MTTPPAVRPFDSTRDLDALAAAAVGVAAAPGPYPPPEAGRTEPELRAWLAPEDAWARWVVEVEGRAVGHVLISAPHDYLHPPAETADAGAREIGAEVGRLFVDPAVTGVGAGALLLHTALEWARSRSLVAGLAVIDGSDAAQRLYVRSGMRLVRSFNGIHGLNHVFVDAGAPTPRTD